MLRVVRVDSLEFENELKNLNQVHVFNSPQFAMLNNLWVDEIHFLLIKSSKVELAITFGERNGVLLSPWSAPFGGFGVAREDISVSLINDSLNLLIDYSRMCNCVELSIILPPSFYSAQFITKLVFCCTQIKLNTSIADINYVFDLFIPTPKDVLNRNYWRNFNRGLRNNLSLERCDSITQKELCYSIIEENRTTLGYPLKMGFDPLLRTAQIIDIDFFLLKNSIESFAAAICYWVTPHIVQVIYWGDYTFKRGEGAMHQLAAQLQLYYKLRHVKFLDVGPSSSNGVPKYGLCDFKESLGCNIALKHSFTFAT